MLMRRMAAALFLILAIVGCAAADSTAVVTGKALLSTTALVPGSSFRMAVRMNVRKGYHIGAPTSKDTYPSKLDVMAPAGVTFGQPVYPNAKMIDTSVAANSKLLVYDGEFTVFLDGRVAKDAEPGARTIAATFSYQACSGTTCLMPAKVVITTKTSVTRPGEKVAPANQGVFATPAETTGQIESFFKHGSALGFVLVFLTGIMLCFTPCVYPMLPVTIGYFGMQSEKRSRRVILLAALYVLGLALAYSVAGMIAARTGREFGWALQNPYVPAGIAVILIALALSMFGLYEIRPPSWLSAGSQGRSGALGALLMGLLFGVVAAPCVGPVTIGLLLFVAKVGRPVFGFAAFFTLALGMGMPLFGLAMFSGSIARLPKAGMWMVAVKKVFGLLLIGAAIYYVTPLVSSYLPKFGETALPLFVAISGLYLGWLEPSLRKSPGMKNTRKLAGIILVAVGIFALPRTSPNNTATMVFQPYSEAAVAQAAREHKPVMIDFAADWCIECNKLNAQTFTAPDVMNEGERFVRLRVDATKSDDRTANAAQWKYAVQGLPTVVFLGKDGHEVDRARVIGFVKAEEMREHMRMAD